MVFVVEKRVIFSLIEVFSIEKVFEVDDYIGEINECERILKNIVELFLIMGVNVCG